MKVNDSLPCLEPDLGPGPQDRMGVIGGQGAELIRGMSNPIDNQQPEYMSAIVIHSTGCR